MGFEDLEVHDELDLAASMDYVVREKGKSTWRQLWEMSRLVLAGARISPWDYYRYRLYDDESYDSDARRRFAGDNLAKRLELRLSNAHWFALADDKLVSGALLASHGLPTPTIRAVLHPFRSSSGATTLSSRDALVDYLRGGMRYPFFGKPIGSFGSEGASLVRAYDPNADELLRHDGTRVAVEDYARSVEELGHSQGSYSPRRDLAAGYLFQDVVTQHPLLREHCGEAIACVRAYVLVEPAGPRIHTAVWKIAAPGNVADNFWRPGNLLGALDLETGEILRVVRGEGTELEELEHSPYTGRPLVGLRLPFFEAVKEVVLTGAALFPGLRYQGWDVAIAPGGPVIVEVNSGSAYSLAQLASGRGLLTDEFRSFLERAAWDSRPLPPHPGLRRRFWRLEGAWRFAKCLLARPRDRTNLRRS